MIIDGVKYRDIFFKISTMAINTFSNVECFICKEKVTKKKYFFNEQSPLISMKKINFQKDLPPIKICNNCVKTPIQAEKIIIPLLKILNGGIIKVRRINIKTKITKEFNY